MFWRPNLDTYIAEFLVQRHSGVVEQGIAHVGSSSVLSPQTRMVSWTSSQRCIVLARLMSVASG